MTTLRRLGRSLRVLRPIRTWHLLAGAGVVGAVLIVTASVHGHGVWSLCLAGAMTVTPDNLWHAWSLAPATVLALGAGGLLYARGIVSVAAGAGSAPSRGTCPVAGAAQRTPVQHGAFALAWLVLAVAWVSPLCRLAATLVSAHMVQHLLLITLAPMLLAAARPAATLRAGIGWPSPRSAPGRLPPPATAAGIRLWTVLYGAAIWLWHVPPIYTAILSSAWLHVVAFAALLLVATRFWAALFDSRGPCRGAALIALLTTLAHTGLLGALLTFSPRLLYPILAPGAAAWGLVPLADQQLAGLIMWVPGAIVYLATALSLAALWLHRAAAPDRSRQAPVSH